MLFILEMLKFFIVAIVAAAVLIVLAKFVLQNVIRRPSDYYLKDEQIQDDAIMEPIRSAEKARGFRQ